LEEAVEGLQDEVENAIENVSGFLNNNK